MLKNTMIVFGLVLLSGVAMAESATLAVAANFSGVIKELVAVFESTSSHRIKVATGSSGKLFTQIHQGAPFDAFLSADQEKPAALIAAGLAVNGSQFTYAQGNLVLWSLKPELIPATGGMPPTDSFQRLAIANPRLAPYGVAAEAVLKYLSLYQELQPKLVIGENISQTYQFVATGNAELGFVALSQLPDQGRLDKGSHWMIPANFYPPIRQDAVLLTRAKNNAAALAMLTFLKSDKAKATLHRFGYR